MATLLFSLGPSDPAHQVIQAAGIATVSKPIEVTVDMDGMIASGLSAPQARLQAINTLTKICEFIENGNKALLPG